MHNSQYCDRENSRIYCEGNIPEKVNVWAGILGNYIIGPFLIDGNLNGPVNLDLL